MRFTSQNEISRAQSLIDGLRTSQEFFNTKKMANPEWRSVKKTNWIDKDCPFKVGKVDERLILRTPTQVK